MDSLEKYKKDQLVRLFRGQLIKKESENIFLAPKDGQTGGFRILCQILSAFPKPIDPHR